MNFESPCQDASLVSITAVEQDAPVPASDFYSSTDMIFTYSDFLVSPSYCNLTVKCKRVTPESDAMPCQDLNAIGQIVWNFSPADYTGRIVAPGSYTFEFEVTASEGNADLTESFSVQITLVDPCIGAVVNAPATTTTTYTIT